MRIVCAPDSFKESMTALQAARAMGLGVHDALPDTECVLAPMSDGGEGFTDAIGQAWDAEAVEVDTLDALGRPIRAAYRLAEDRAVLDVASCSGLELIAPQDRRIERANTRGLGILIRDALSRGARSLLIGIGGTATNDAGAGMLVALGARLLDAGGAEVRPSLLELSRVVRVDDSALARLFEGVEVRVASDVTNPLCGPEGASAVFGPQKGLAPKDVPAFDAALHAFARASGRPDLAERPGSGAAGGLGFALRAFLGAELVPGLDLDLVAEALGLAEAIEGADLVLTGEGKVDGQSARGKTPVGVAALAGGLGVPVFLFAGALGDGAEALLDVGATRIIAISMPDEPLPVALRRGPENLRHAVAAALRQSR